MVKMTVELKEYALEYRLDDEKDAIDHLSGYDNGYISDKVHEVADLYTPIYDSDIWKNAEDIQDSIEEALEEGLCEISRGVKLTSIFQTGYYHFYRTVLSANIDIIAFNKIAEKVNEHIKGMSEEQLEELAVDFDLLTDEIEDKADNFSINHSDFNVIDDIAQVIINIYLTEEEED